MRCKHNNSMIYEHYTMHYYHRFQNGTYSDSGEGNADLTGTVSVKCKDCGLDRTYGFRNRPAWLQKRLEEVTEYEYS